MAFSTRRDGVHLDFYNDGSGPSLHLTKDRNTKYPGVNERLDASRGKGSLNTNSQAETLRYIRDVNFCYLRYLVISGDLGRSFPPQPWARGVLPILSVARIHSFHQGAGRSVLEFNPLCGWSDEAAAAVGAATWLLLSGWKNGFIRGPRRTQELLGLLRNMGLTCSARQFREAIRPLVAAGRIKKTNQRSAPNYDKFSPGWEADTNSDSVAEMNLWLGSLAKSFEPFAKRKEQNLHLPKFGRPYVKFQ